MRDFTNGQIVSEWVLFSEVLDLFRISRSTLLRWVAIGIFPKPVKFGEGRGTYRFRRVEVDAWLAEREAASLGQREAANAI